jgi:hypothetical protein
MKFNLPNFPMKLSSYADLSSFVWPALCCRSAASVFYSIARVFSIWAKIFFLSSSGVDRVGCTQSDWSFRLGWIGRTAFKIPWAPGLLYWKNSDLYIVGHKGAFIVQDFSWVSSGSSVKIGSRKLSSLTSICDWSQRQMSWSVRESSSRRFLFGAPSGGEGASWRKVFIVFSVGTGDLKS